MLNRYKILLITMVSICICLLLIGCDHTDLTGEVKISEGSIRVNEEVPLLLKVPEELSDIHSVMWGVIYDDERKFNDEYILYGETLLNTYTEKELKEIFGVEELNYDRISIFLPNKSGKYLIVVDGFYKQTNPQPITEMDIEVK